MLAFRNRFHGHGSLRWVYQRGKAIRGKYFVIKYSENPRRKQPRISIVISKKIYKKAVPRNQIRRRMYELFRHELADIRDGSDVVCIISSPEIRSVGHEELRDLVRSMLLEADLYKKQ